MLAINMNVVVICGLILRVFFFCTVSTVVITIKTASTAQCVLHIITKQVFGEVVQHYSHHIY